MLSGLPMQDNMRSAHGSMNHIAFNVPADKFESDVARLHDRGVKTSAVLTHDDDTEWQIAPKMQDGVFVRSDRYVFGMGNPAILQNARAARLAGVG